MGDDQESVREDGQGAQSTVREKIARAAQLLDGVNIYLPSFHQIEEIRKEIFANAD